MPFPIHLSGYTGGMTHPRSAIEPELLQLLVCPLTRSSLKLEGDCLVATVGGLRYPVRDGIPIMLVDEAQLPAGITSLDEFKRRFADQIPA